MLLGDIPCQSRPVAVPMLLGPKHLESRIYLWIYHSPAVVVAFDRYRVNEVGSTVDANPANARDCVRSHKGRSTHKLLNGCDCR
jgi:hypothetical protein